ncbi:MAG: hypothetical protein IJH38_04025 [Clostridia bacterium]|nr:hypothetical protein [Clostridia bacterium]
MKRWIIVIVALMFALVAALPGWAEQEASPSERFCGRWQDPAFGRAMLRIMPSEDPGLGEGEPWFDVWMTWGDSASSEGVWTMVARYAPHADALTYQSGEMAYVTYGQDGEETARKVQWADAEGAFTLADGKLLWSDSREERAAAFAFEPVEKWVPTAEAFRERYFLPLSEYAPGTAGSSLKLAVLCAELCGFADEYCLWDTDIPTMRANMLEAWTGLDEAARGRFDENFTEVIALADLARSDYASVAGQFEDAGAGTMAWLIKDREARASWDTLIAHTWTLGNGE